MNLKRGEKFQVKKYRMKKKKSPTAIRSKLKTQETKRDDLKKFLKRVSTPQGTKSKITGIVSSHDFNKIISKRGVSLQFYFLRNIKVINLIFTSILILICYRSRQKQTRSNQYQKQN